MMASVPDRKDVANWDLSDLYPPVGSAGFDAVFSNLESRAHAFERHLAAAKPLEPANAGLWADLMADKMELERDLDDFYAYVYCRFREATDDAERRKAHGRALELYLPLERAQVQVLAALHGASDQAVAALKGAPQFAECADHVEKLVALSKRMMRPELERLAADLERAAFDGWERLYDQLSSGLTFEMAWPDRGPERLPVSRAPGLFSDPSPEVRQAAMAGVKGAWGSIAVPIAAALNGIAAMRLALLKHRSGQDVLDAALSQHRLSRASVSQMRAAIRRHLPSLQRYLKTKARLMGKDALAFEDLNARLAQAGEMDLTLDAVKSLIVRAFDDASEGMAATALRVFERGWLETEQKPGRGFFGFCSNFPKSGEVRIFSPFGGTFTDATVLAHELGHAHHATAMNGMDYWRLQVPMPLAETASNIGESLMRNALTDRADRAPAARLVALDIKLGKATRALLFWSALFDFEREFYTQRAEGPLEPEQLNAIMRTAQRRWYGDALADDGAFDLLWAHVPLFYMTFQAFHSIAYTFGHLFSAGILDRLQGDASFASRYDALLRATGSMPIEALAETYLGQDLTEPGFWDRALGSLNGEVDAFDELAGSL